MKLFKCIGRNRLVCRVVMCIQGVAVPYGPLMTGTIRLSKGVRREAGSEESRRRNPGSDVQEAVGQSDGCGGYKANVVWVTRPRTGMPDCHSEAAWVDPTIPGEEGMSYLERSPIAGPLTPDYRSSNATGQGSEKSAEVVVTQPGEGPNLLMQGADGRLR
jgi:hypothetical protein